MQEVEKLYFFDTKKKKVMPYALLSLEVENFRGIKHLKIDGIPADTKWIFFTGENGFGKTSILQSISSALFHEHPMIFRTSSYSTRAKFINDYQLVSYGQNEHGGVFYVIDSDLFPSNPIFSAYGSSRLNLTQTSNSELLDDRYSYLDNVYSNQSTLLNIEQTLIESYAYNLKRFKQISKFFNSVIPHLKEIKVEVINGEPKVIYLEQDETGHGYNPISFSQLAAGYRNILAMFGDMIIRLQKLQPEVKSISDLKGIVIIDEIELHLHPKYQKWLPSKLSELFPNIQFIVSTHSPIPLLGAPRESVFLKVNRNEEQGITVERIDIDIAGLNPNMVLTSPVFGFDDIFSSSKDKNTVIRKEDVYNDALFYKKLDERLDEHVGSEREQELMKLMQPTAQK